MSDPYSQGRLLTGNGAAFSPPPATQSSEISFRQIFGVLRRRYRIVLALMVLGVAAGVFLAMQESATYKADAVLRVAGERRALTGNMETPTPEVGRETDPLLSLVQLVQSRSVLGAVVDSLGLALRSETPKFLTSALVQVSVDSGVKADSVLLDFADDRVTARYQNRQVTGWYGQVLPLGPIRFAVAKRPSVPHAVLSVSTREVAIDWLHGNLTVLPRAETDLIDVAFVSSDPRLAQQIVNRAVKTFQGFNAQSAKEQSKRRRKVLQDQLADADSILSRAQSELAAFRVRYQVGSSESKLASEQSALLALEQQRTQLEADRNTYDALLRQLKDTSSQARAVALRALAASPAIGDNPRVGDLYQRLSTYQIRFDSMTDGRWGKPATNPDVVLLRNMIKNTQDELVMAVSAHLQSIGTRINTLSDLRQHGGQSIQLLPAVVEEELRLTNRVESFRALSNDLRQKYQEARLVEEVEAGDVEIVDLAEVPYMALAGTTIIKVVLGLALGLLLGGCVAFVLEALNTSIRRPEDIESVLHLPGLAVIPRLEAGGAAGRRRAALIKGKKSPGLARSSRTPIGAEPQPFSVGTEAFRMLRTSLLWSDGADQLRALVVTSAAPGDGKTLTAANLAVSFANEGLRVLLVDCDIRRPRLHGLFRMQRSPGLLDVLAPPSNGSAASVGTLSFDPHHDSGDDPLAHVLRPTAIRGLTLLPCGALPTNASNLLSGIRMRSLLAELKQRFDLVVLDTPPVLATADAGILGSIVDGVLLVVRAGQTDKSAAQRAHQQLTQAGARVLGGVLNDPKGEISQYGEYYYPYEYTPEV